MFFSEDQIQQLWTGYQTAHINHQQLLRDFVLTQPFQTDKANEYINHGFSRRAFTLMRCIDNIYENCPPDQQQLLSSDERKDIEINLQAFLFNVFGCLDNLAWVWVSERNISRRDGTALPNSHIGLRPTNVAVRASLPEHVQNRLNEMADWFKYLEDFRHALAHRIPLYIPPYGIIEGQAERHRRLEVDRDNALREGHDNDLQEIKRQLAELQFFYPVFTHSFSERALRVVFHSQVLADFNTIHEIANLILNELAD